MTVEAIDEPGPTVRRLHAGMGRDRPDAQLARQPQVVLCARPGQILQVARRNAHGDQTVIVREPAGARVTLMVDGSLSARPVTRSTMSGAMDVNTPAT